MALVPSTGLPPTPLNYPYSSNDYLYDLTLTGTILGFALTLGTQLDHLPQFKNDREKWNYFLKSLLLLLQSMTVFAGSGALVGHAIDKSYFGLQNDLKTAYVAWMILGTIGYIGMVLSNDRKVPPSKTVYPEIQILGGLGPLPSVDQLVDEALRISEDHENLGLRVPNFRINLPLDLNLDTFFSDLQRGFIRRHVRLPSMTFAGIGMVEHYLILQNVSSKFVDLDLI